MDFNETIRKVRVAKHNRSEDLWIGSIENNLNISDLRDLFFEINKLNHLRSLTINNSNLENIPYFLALEKLKQLDLQNNILNRVDSLSKLRVLNTLNLSGNKLINIEGINNIVSLKEVDISNNLIFDLSSLKNLVNLEKLSINSNKIGQISSLQDLNKLDYLSLSYNAISDISPIQNLTNLNQLYLNDNQIDTVSPLWNLRNLDVLNLARNKINTIESLGLLKFLTQLDLSNNHITDLRPLEGLQNLVFLNLSGNELLEEIIPIEILRDFKNPRRILNYYFEKIRAEETFPINEARMVLIGQGFVGKTSLRKCLIEGNCKDDEPKTEGLEVVPWEILFDKQGRKIKLNVWDFGGQEIYHTSHKFFFKTRCLYILVLDVSDRVEIETNKFRYWLNTIETLIKDDPRKKVPIIIVCNKAERRIERFDVEGFSENQINTAIGEMLKEFVVIEENTDVVTFINEKYKNLEIKGVYATSCKQIKMLGIDSVKQAILRELEGLGVSQTETKAFFNDKNRVEQCPDNYIKRQHFEKLCPDMPEDRLFQFSSCGIITTFEKANSDLKDLIILKPKWLTESISSSKFVKTDLSDLKAFVSLDV